MNPNINPEHVITLQGQQYCTYRGVLECAHAMGLEGIRTRILQVPGPDNEYVAIVEAEVRLKDGRVFVDAADASPKNVTAPLLGTHPSGVHPCKGRARDAVNIGEALPRSLRGRVRSGNRGDAHSAPGACARRAGHTSSSGAGCPGRAHARA